MKVLITLFVLISQPVIAADMTFVRSLFKQAVDDEDQAKKLIVYLKSLEVNPLILGYTASVNILLAKHCFNPIRQYNHFQEGRDMLEKAISEDISSCELRYLRFSIQTNIPGFLNYKKNIEADKIFLINSLRNKVVLDNETRMNIVSVLSNSSYCSDNEKKLVREVLKWNM